MPVNFCFSKHHSYLINTLLLKSCNFVFWRKLKSTNSSLNLLTETRYIKWNAISDLHIIREQIPSRISFYNLVCTSLKFMSFIFSLFSSFIKSSPSRLNIVFKLPLSDSFMPLIPHKLCLKDNSHTLLKNV